MYTVQVLDDPAGVTSASPLRINDAGVVVGTCFNLQTGFFDGIIWDAGGNGTILSNAYPLDIAEGIGIRDDGTILAAASENASSDALKAAVLDADGTYTLLPSLPPDDGVFSAAFDMNDAGVIAGRSALVATPFWQSVPNDAAIWEDGKIASIGTLGGFFATARHINNNNIIIGESNTATSDLVRGFVWDEADGMQEIIPLQPGVIAFFDDINDDNVIVGVSPLGSNHYACIWTDYTQPPDTLELMAGDINTAAVGINNAGDIVGSAETPQGDRARLWMDGEVYDLNDYLAEPAPAPITSAAEITDTGLILATIDDPSAGTLDVVLTPVVTCPGDIDGDGRVGVGDLLDLLAAWGECRDCAADLDGDSIVGVSDLLDLQAAWGACDD